MNRNRNKSTLFLKFILIEFIFIVKRRQINEKSEDEKELPKVFLKTLEYCDRFSHFKNNDTIIAVRK